MILFKGKRLKPEWGDDMPPGTTFVLTTKASMRSDVFEQWLHPFAKYKVAGNPLLIYSELRTI
jgi:hypothetical protein